SGGMPPYTIQWEDGPTTADRTDLAEGDYSVTVADDFGCWDSLTVSMVSLIESAIMVLPADADCFGSTTGSVAVSAPDSSFQYSLDGVVYTPEPIFEGLGAGTYTLFVLTENDCESSLDFEVGEPATITLSLSADSLLCLGDSTLITSKTNVEGPTEYNWEASPWLSCLDCPTPMARPVRTSTFVLTVSDTAGCMAKDTITIEVEVKRRLYFPNVFSPNGDGFNDRFFPFAGPEVSRILTFKVFDRWGELLFEDGNFLPNDPQFGWDGTFRGQLMPVGVFVWMAEVEYVDGVREQLAGDITLVR
ncbi:MAG: gliding motility-associated C-terminal domain-containing protein, partial [Bacteroidota bacterium]